MTLCFHLFLRFTPIQCMFSGFFQCETIAVGHVMRRSIWHAGTYSYLDHFVKGCHAGQLLEHVPARTKPSAFYPVQLYVLDTAVWRTKGPEGSQNEEGSHSIA